VTSDCHRKYPPKEGVRFHDLDLEDESTWMRYGQSRLANILHMNEMHKRWGPRKGAAVAGEVWFASIHPSHFDS
jgi:hypothetical protein